MMRLQILFFRLLLIVSIIGYGQNAKQYIDNYNVLWNTQSKNASESMPLVGGDIGCNVWVENGEILVYVSRSGSFDENGCHLKLGRLRVKLTPNPFEEGISFNQELKLHDGYIEINGEKKIGNNVLKATVKLWVDVFNPVIHFEVDANKPIDVNSMYENWRTKDVALKPGDKKERFSIFNIMAYPGKIIKTKDHISFKDNGVLFYHQNPKKKITPELTIKQQELEAYKDEIVDDLKGRISGGYVFGENFVISKHGKGHYINTPYGFWEIKSKKPQKKHQLFIATHIAQARNISDWKNKLFTLVKKTPLNTKDSFEKSSNWWHQFWERSWIVIPPGKVMSKGPVWQMIRNYQLFRYQLGGNVFGEYPTKFNGGNLTFDPVLVGESFNYDPDWRKWGGNFFTAQNQRLVYWPMLKSGDFDMIKPQFELYRKALPGARARVKEHFGHDGAVYCEYASMSGIALGDGWGWSSGKKRMRGEEIPFGDSRADGLKDYKSFVEKGVMANRSISYHWESQVEHAFMILEYHRFTGADISQYMMFIEESLIFFDKHYRLRQKMRNGKELDENGKLVFYPSTSCESYRGAKNPSDLISGLKACIESLLTLEDKYLSNKKKAYYKTYLKHLPELNYGEENGERILKPAESWGRYQNVECPQFYPLFPFNRFSLDKDDMTVFKNTYKYGKFHKNMIQSWHQDGIFFARMGMAKEALDYNTKKLKNSSRRFPTFWGPGHDWVPDHNWGGSGMLGLQEMLMQTNDEKIILFPAWPKERDVHFKFHAPKNTIVEVELKNGEIIHLKVTPSERLKDVIAF